MASHEGSGAMKAFWVVVLVLGFLVTYWIGFERGYIWGVGDGIYDCVSIMQSAKAPTSSQKAIGI